MDRKLAIRAPVTLASCACRRHAIIVRTAIGVGVAAILVFAFIRLVNFRSVFHRLEHLNIALALLCGAVFLGAYCVRALRWRRFLAPHIVGVWRVIAIYQVAIFINWLLPVRGGELVKSLLLRQLDHIPMSQSLPTVAMDKTMDLLPAVVLLIILPFLPFHLTGALWALLLFILAVLFIGALFLGLAAWRRKAALGLLAWCAGKLPGFLRRRSAPFIISFVDALLALVARPRLLLVAAAYTTVAVCLDALFCLLAFAAVGAAISFPIVLFGYTFYNLAYILPTPPGQIGSNELLGLVIFSGLLGINRSVVAAMFLFSHPWTALLMVGCGLFCLSAMGLSLRSTLAMARESAQAGQR